MPILERSGKAWERGGMLIGRDMTDSILRVGDVEDVPRGIGMLFDLACRLLIVVRQARETSQDKKRVYS